MKPHLTFKEFYSMCDNVGAHTYFQFLERGKLVVDGKYMELHPKWYDVHIKGFQIIANDVTYIYV